MSRLNRLVADCADSGTNTPAYTLCDAYTAIEGGKYTYLDKLVPCHSCSTCPLGKRTTSPYQLIKRFLYVKTEPVY